MWGTMRIGIDIGGTFIDIVIFDPHTGQLDSLKVSSDPKKLEEGVMRGLEGILARLRLSAAEVTQLVHGTTVATNALLEGRWAKTALITTEGFRDILEIGRQNRPELYNFFTERPKPIVGRELRFEVPERLDYQGRVLKPLDEERVKHITIELANQGVESVAVVFLFSYLNPAHERRVKELFRAQLTIPVLLSCEVLPEFREYERTSTTVMSAALVPIVSRYLQKLDEATQRLGIRREWRIMQSNAGIVSSKLAQANPITLVLSGPAGGVEGARFIGELAGFKNLITMDMGGTSCDISLIADGKPLITTEGEIAKRPLRLPMLDIHTIGAGGGSIAWIDSGGALRVGPQSAGADPGPACYGRGGTEPTVTDAQLVLGRLDPDSPLGDIPKLHLHRAQAAIEEKIARPSKMSLAEAAWGILEVADASMERAIRVITVERGRDPREFALLAFGGAGPLHAVRLAEKLGIKTVIVPASAGVLSALGLLTADLVHHFVQTVLKPAEELDLAHVNAIYDGFRAEGRSRLREDGLDDEQIFFVPSMDLRYRGQAYEINLPVPNSFLSQAQWAEIYEGFHEAHQRLYGHASPGEPIEVVNLRLMAIGKGLQPALKRRDLRSSGASSPREREVYFPETGWVTSRIFSREFLPDAITGPAIIEGRESTIAVFPQQQATVDDWGNLIIEVRA
jgi:N-methylhydantoinase A